tara:strand:- start:1464 stop:1925 length:462 start_codon:yes stop_codon:yes gene_type:complete
MTYDLANSLSVTQLLDPATTTATVTSATLDRNFTIGAAMLILTMGESGDTLSGSVYWSLSIQDSSDDSSWSNVTSSARVSFAAVDSSGIYATIDAAAEDDAAFPIGYTGPERYVRIVATKTGTHSNGTPIGVLACVNNIHKPASGSDDGSATG